MNNDSTTNEEQIAAISALIEQSQKTSIDSADYVTATVSAFFSGGFFGANIQGWITYEGGAKLFFSGKGEMITGAAIGQGVAIPVTSVLNPDILLNANTIAWKAIGLNRNGVLAIFADDRVVSILPLISAGWGVGTWSVGGTGSFRRP